MRPVRDTLRIAATIILPACDICFESEISAVRVHAGRLAKAHTRNPCWHGGCPPGAADHCGVQLSSLVLSGRWKQQGPVMQQANAFAPTSQ